MAQGRCLLYLGRVPEGVTLTPRLPLPAAAMLPGRAEVTVAVQPLSPPMVAAPLMVRTAEPLLATT